jgi:hypothetical protein
MAGYSKRTLIEKLGIKTGSSILLLNAPPDYGQTLGALPDGVKTARKLAGRLDFIQFFTDQRADLEKRFPALRTSLSFDGTLWISWPKAAAKVKTDLNENIVREIGLRNGLVDVKVCAVDERWSGLKFIYRLEDRK